MKGNFDIHKQCPQVYIYILAIITSALVAVKYGARSDVIKTLLTGTVVTVLLMGINFCDWSFQWLTWIIAAIFMISATVNILIFFNGLPDDSENNSVLITPTPM